MVRLGEVGGAAETVERAAPLVERAARAFLSYEVKG